MIDLLKIAKTEANGGNLFKKLSDLFEDAKIKPRGYPDAVVWQGGNHNEKIIPVAHSLTDAYALLGTIAAIDILGLPFYAVPMWSQFRHDTELEALAWFGNIPSTSIKWSTAGDAYVNDGKGNKVVVMGKSGNAHLRTQAGVYCKLVNDSRSIGRIATKPTQAMEDGINAGLHSWLIKDTKFEVGRRYAVDPYEEHKESIDKIIKLLPSDFKNGMDNWSGRIEQHIADTNYGLLIWDLLNKQNTVVLSTDLDGDRLTDLLADISDPLRAYSGMVANKLGKEINTSELWEEMGYTTGNGRDMTSVMHRMDGPPIHEQTLGSADAMLLRLLDGDEWVRGTKQPYDPRIHFVLIRDAYIDANPDNKNLHDWLDNALKKFDEVYEGSRPGFLEGYKSLKQAITPWGK